MKKFPAPSYSHSGEDRLIAKLAPTIAKTKIYVDVGAYHPTQYSNTYLLYLSGWRGLCIDADTQFRDQFMQFRNLDIIRNCGVSKTTGFLDFFVFPDRSQNTFCESTAKETARRLGTAAAVVKKVPVEPLSALLSEQGILDFDYLNVDVEGYDTDVLESLDFETWRPSLITVEDHSLNLHDVRGSATFNLLTSRGYSLHSKVNYTGFYIFKPGNDTVYDSPS